MHHSVSVGGQTLSITGSAWKEIDKQLLLQKRLATGESIRISANAIKKFTGREPRLMTKFDARGQRPSVLSKATLLPVRNGEYLILPGDGYRDLDPPRERRPWPIGDVASRLLSLPWEEGPASESQLIDMAFASGLLDEFLQETGAFLTVRGRLRSPEFDFFFPSALGSEPVNVSGVQVEVDAGYEGENLNIVEAKLGSWADFHVRQLYYPIRMWQERVSGKSIRAVFMSYSDRVASLRLYSFCPLEHYGGLRLEKAVDYFIDELEQEPSISEILVRTPSEPAPNGVTFPQADDMRKVLDVVDATAAGVSSRAEIVDRYGFAERQAQYYPSAARYLGLLHRTGTAWRLTELGQSFSSASRAARHRIVIERLAALPVFRTALEHALTGDNTLPSTEMISEWIADASLVAGLPLTGSTLARRAATVRSWTSWALETALP